MPKIVYFGELPERLVLIGQKLVENAKIQKFKCDILSNFQTMWGQTINLDKCFTWELRQDFISSGAKSHHQPCKWAKNVYAKLNDDLA